MSKENDNNYFQVSVFDLAAVLGDDVKVEGFRGELNDVFAIQFQGPEDSCVTFLQGNEEIEDMASTLEKVAMELRTLKDLDKLH